VNEAQPTAYSARSAPCTATEVALLGISATQAGQGISIWSIMVFPALLAAGISLVDTSDGVLMLGVYNWASISPMRTLYYNLVITAVSIVVAVLIGGIEGLGLITKSWFATSALSGVARSTIVERGISASSPLQ
jgi:HoxN/HupN/NixA family high-affinity nickel-transporter